MMRYLLIYLSTLAVMLPLDLLFIGTVGKKLFESHLGNMMLSSPRLVPAGLFYVLYLAGVVTFVNGATPSAWQQNAAYGALFGLFCYATFELTNMSLLKPWSWAIVVPDMVWGIVLTAVSASLGGVLAQWLMRAMKVT